MPSELRLVLLDVLFLHHYKIVLGIGDLLLLWRRLLSIVGIFRVVRRSVWKLRCEFRGFGGLLFLGLGFRVDGRKVITMQMLVNAMTLMLSGTHGMFLKYASSSF
jgi:hypothetical protein